MIRRFILRCVYIAERFVVGACIAAALAMCLLTAITPAWQADRGSIQNPKNDPQHLRSSNLRKWT